MIKQTALFIPGNQPKMHISADVFGADCLIFDLEDSVAIHQKDSARLLVKEMIQAFDLSYTEVIVRINPVDSSFYQDDLKEMLQARPDALMIPKATKAVIEKVEADLKHYNDIYPNETLKLYIIIETAMGVETALETCLASKRIIGVLLGGEDLCTDMKVTPTKQRIELQYPRSKIAMTAAACNIMAWDTPFVDIDDHDGFKEDALMAKALGFGGKVCIHPNQIDIVKEVFAISEKQLKEAQEIIEAYELAQQQGLGAFSYRGKMIDKPILERAQQIVAASSKE